MANVATKFGLALDDVAGANLEKTRGRFLSDNAVPDSLDNYLPDAERLPYRFEVQLIDSDGAGLQSVRVVIDGETPGSQ